MRTKRPILLAEDDRIDAMTVQRALHDIKVSNEVIIRGNGEEALEFLRDGTNQIP